MVGSHPQEPAVGIVRGVRISRALQAYAAKKKRHVGIRIRFVQFPPEYGGVFMKAFLLAQVVKQFGRVRGFGRLAQDTLEGMPCGFLVA